MSTGNTHSNTSSGNESESNSVNGGSSSSTATDPNSDSNTDPKTNSASYVTDTFQSGNISVVGSAGDGGKDKKPSLKIKLSRPKTAANASVSTPSAGVTATYSTTSPMNKASPSKSIKSRPLPLTIASKEVEDDEVENDDDDEEEEGEIQEEEEEQFGDDEEEEGEVEEDDEVTTEMEIDEEEDEEDDDEDGNVNTSKINSSEFTTSTANISNKSSGTLVDGVDPQATNDVSKEKTATTAPVSSSHQVDETSDQHTDVTTKNDQESKKNDRDFVNADQEQQHSESKKINNAPSNTTSQPHVNPYTSRSRSRSESFDAVNMLKEATQMPSPIHNATSLATNHLSNENSKNLNMPHLTESTSANAAIPSVLVPTTATSTTTPSSLTVMGPSFLDSLGEEQRRVRLRHLPDVSGFRKLHKSEIKRDITLVKSLLRGGGSGSSGVKIVPSTTTASGKASGTSGNSSSNNALEGGGDSSSSGVLTNHNIDHGAMDIDNDLYYGDSNLLQNIHSDNESYHSGGEDDGSATHKVSAKASKSGSKEVKQEIDPYPQAFVLPFPDTPYICTSLEDSTTVKPTSDKKSDSPGTIANSATTSMTLFSSPQVVESITAFNPPRPPESVGPKKIHRLLRWEQNPQDIEVDLNNYKKTVNRTRQELHKIELERERIDIIGGHLKRHMMNHFKSMKDEIFLLNHICNITQKECVKAAELLTSKTRSGGLGASQFRDVISVLKSRGEKLNLESPSDTKYDLDSSSLQSWCVSGIGGITGYKSDVPLASGWLLPGDKVSSPYGLGTVVHLFGAETLDVYQPPPAQIHAAKQSSGKNHGFGRGINNPSTSPSRGSKGPQNLSTNTKPRSLITLPPRVCVRLPYGIGFFSLRSITLLEKSASYSDEKLATRWMNLIESSKLTGTSLDDYCIDNPITTSTTSYVKRPSHPTPTTYADNKSCDADDDLTETSQQPSTLSDSNSQEDEKVGFENEEATDHISGNKVEKSVGHRNKRRRLLPIGSNVLNSSGLTIGHLTSLQRDQLETGIDELMKQNFSLTSAETNASIPPNVKVWEQDRGELYVLEGKVRQLQNQLFRQRRLRLLNEESKASGNKRCEMFESLLVEMKEDLNSMKYRLNDELLDLGIDQDQASQILTKHYSIESDNNELQM